MNLSPNASAFVATLKTTLASRLLIALGALKRIGPAGALTPLLTPQFLGQHTNPRRNAERAALTRVGRRQYRKQQRYLNASKGR